MEGSSEPEEEDFIDLYLKYTDNTECPTFFHRWAGLSILSAMLGRNTYFRNGHFKIYPNIYALIIGEPGTKKSTAIRMASKLLKKAGYNKFAAKKTRQEKFLIDLAEASEEGNSATDNLLDENLWEGMDEEDYLDKPPSEVFIAADEFGNFIGTANLDFMSILGDLWDYEGVFDYRLKKSKSVYINEPAITILGGITPTQLNTTFPQEAIGQGFFSRLIIIHADRTDVRHTWMPDPDEELEAKLIAILKNRRATLNGRVTLSAEARDILDRIYQTWKPMTDIRFEAYGNRRFPQLLTLCMLLAASRGSTEISGRDALRANTVLSYTEFFMPRALGEFGKSRNSGVTHSIMTILNNASGPISTKELWKSVCTDLDRREQLTEILANLLIADKIQAHDDGSYLAVREVMQQEDSSLFDWSVFTEKERYLL